MKQIDLKKKIYQSNIEYYSDKFEVVNKMYVDHVMFDEDKNRKLKNQVELRAKELMHKEFPFDVLCWELAEIQLIIEKSHGNYTRKEVRKMEEKIFNSTISYKEICWIIATLTSFLGQQDLYPQIKIKR